MKVILLKGIKSHGKGAGITTLIIIGDLKLKERFQLKKRYHDQRVDDYPEF